MAAASDRVLCSKPCSLQNADKSLTEGTAYVFQSLVRFVGRGGIAGTQKLELAVGDIKGQKRSKGKPLLLIETGTKGRHVLHFSSEDDREAVVAAVTSAQAAATQGGGSGGGAAGAGGSSRPAAAAPTAAAAAAAAAAGNKSAVQLAQQLGPAARKELLAKNAVLAGQHKALVADSRALTDDEFWSSAAVQKMAGLSGMPTTTPRASKKGLANRIVDLARQQESGDGRLVQLKFTPEDEAQLLAEKPALRQLYDAQVGVQLSREEFWQRYFRYYMAKRSKREAAVSRFKQLQQNLTADSAAAVADMTGAAAQQDTSDVELEALISALDATSNLDASARKTLKRRLNPAVDLAAGAEDRLTSDGYGLAHNSARSETDQVKGYTALTQQLAADYNIHGAAVMGHAAGQQGAAAGAGAAGSSRRQAGASSSAAAAAAAAAGGQPGGQAEGEMSDEENQRHRDNAGGSGLDDLNAPLEQQFEELKVNNPRLYFSNQQQQPPLQQQQQQPGEQQQQDVVALLRAINPDELLEQPMQPSVAFQVLSELTGGDAADAARRGGPTSLPQQRLDFMQQQAMVVDELLRHFWGLIPVNTAEKEAKLGRIQTSLDSCYELLGQVIEQAEPVHKAALTRLAKPLWEQLDTASKAAKQIHTALAARKKRT